MDRNGISGAPRRDRRRGHRRPRGLHVKDRGGYWYIIGTIRIARRSIRVRESVGLAATDEHWDAACKLRDDRASEIREDVIHGVKPSVPVAVAADQYIGRRRRRPLGATTIAYIQELTARFRLRKLSSIPESEWILWVEQRQAGNRSETRERYLTAIVAFLAWCAKKPRGWLKELPAFERDQAARNQTTRSRRRVRELTPELIAFLLDHAAPHLRAQMAVEASTGARVGSILHGCRLCDVILAEGREQITFHDTKNGEPVTAALHPFAAAELSAYLEHRKRLFDREGPLFLTHRGKPYRGNANKTAWNAMKRRAIATHRKRLAAELRRLRAAGDRAAAIEALGHGRDREALIGQVTQHWFRHNLATRILAGGGDVRAAMEQGGWLDVRSVLGYAHDVPSHRRAVVDSLPLPGSAAFGHRDKKVTGK